MEPTKSSAGLSGQDNLDEMARRQVEDALRESNERYCLLVEHAPLGILSVDPQGNILAVNPALLDILGSPSAEATKAINLFSFPPLVQAGIAGDIRECLESGKSIASERRYTSKWGKTSFVRLHLTPIFDPAGQIRLVQLIVEDITEREQAEEARLREKEAQARAQAAETVKQILEKEVAERSRVEAALRSSEQQYKTILNTAMDGFLVLDGQGKLLDVNDAYCHRIGYSHSELSDMSLQELSVQETDEELVEHLEHIRVQGSDRFESKHKCKDGRTIDMDVSVNYQPHPDGGRFYCFLSDITRREQTEALLEQRARQLILLNEIGRQVAASLELEGILDTAVRLVQQGFGYHHVALFLIDHTHEQLVMRARAGSFASIFPELHSLRLDQGMVGWVARHGEKLLANDVLADPHYLNPFPELLPTRSELSMPIRIGNKVVGVLDIQSPQCNAFDKNDVRVMEILADQVAIALENARLYQSVQQELAGREYVERALRESEKRYRTLVETSPSAIFYTDMHAQISLCNRPAARMFRFEDPQAMIGMDALALVDLQDRQMLSDEIAGRRVGYIQQDIEVALFRKDGARFPAEVSLAVVGDDTGAPTGIIGVVRDLTERKRLEQYRLRTERLAAIGNTAAILAHEVKTPCNPSKATWNWCWIMLWMLAKRKSICDCVLRNLNAW